MCLSKYSNLEHLREAAINLYSSEDHGNMNSLCEKELADLIHKFYQKCEVTSGEKRKHEVDTNRDSKKLRVLHKVSNILSALELLPNEVYEMILKPLGGDDKKNLRITSKGLYHKTTLVAPMFQNWCFDASRGTPPDFILETKKNFSVYVLKEYNATASNLIYRFAYRISSIKLKSVSVWFLMNSLTLIKPAEYPYLTLLDLEAVTLDSYSLLMLAPQLENLRLSKMKNHEFDISSVDEDSKCFTKLKTLKLLDIKIDAKKILTKCSNTLEYLMLDRVILPDKNFEQDLFHLHYLSISLDFNDPEGAARNLLSKCSRSLRTLKIRNYLFSTEFSTLLEQPMKITSLEIKNVYIQINSVESNIESFLFKCPLVQKLTIHRYDKEVNDIVLKDLTNLKLYHCGSRFMTSVLEQASKYSLKTVNIRRKTKVINRCQFPVISKLDKSHVHQLDKASEDEQKQALDKVVMLFPIGVKVITEKLENKTTFRRVYGIQ